MRPFRIFIFVIIQYFTAVDSTCLYWTPSDSTTRIPIVLDKPEDGVNLDCDDNIRGLFPMMFGS